MSRFYKEVSAAQSGDVWHILLDGKPVKNADGDVIAAPTEALAEAAADEWREVKDKIDIRMMPMTRLCGGAVLMNDEERAAMTKDMIGYASTDLLCYWSDDDGLQAQQKEQWDPILSRFESEFGVRFERTSGVMPIQQPDDSQQLVQQQVEALDNYHLIAASQMVITLGSVLLFLAWMNNYCDTEQVIALSQLDETYQADKWGEDEEATQARAAKSDDLRLLARYIQLMAK